MIYGKSAFCWIAALGIILLSANSEGIAQSTDLRNDQVFFIQQQAVYQGWLEETGLNPALQVERIQVDSHKVTLTLQFNYKDSDTATSAWNRLRQDFQENFGLALEERLFFKFSTVMEVKLEQAELRIINYPKYGELPVVDGTIYFDSAFKKVARKGIFRKEEKSNVFIPSFILDTSFTKRLSMSDSLNFTEQLQYKLNQELANRLRNYFEQKTDKKYVYLPNKNPIQLEVMNIKSEVIPAGWVSFNNPNEHLVITIDHKITKKGLDFFCTIDGKFGNGLFKPRSLRGFRDMSPNYKHELKRYTNEFATDKIDKWVKEILRKIK
jgi:hypothetical protein